MELAKKFSGTKPSGMVRVFQAIEKMSNVLNLSIGEPDFVTEPDIVDAAAKAAKEGFTHYPPLQGYREVREAACAYWERHHAFKASPDEVYISVGGLHIPWLAFGALLNPGDEVMLIEPYFTPYEAQIRGNGGVPVPVKTREENNFAPSIDELRAAVEVVEAARVHAVGAVARAARARVGLAVGELPDGDAGDVLHRDHDGYGDHHYTDQSGRNDITRCLVAVDKKNIYFAAETAAPLTPSTDPNWMLLLFDTDEDGAYDYLIQNSKLIDSNGVSHSVDMAIGEKSLEIAIPRTLINKTGKHISLRFKWADNPINPSDIISISTTGDTAPNRRFAYHFVWKHKRR